MRLQRIETVDLGVPGRRVLDLTEQPAGLLAVTGSNGTGKSTLLECGCPGALYRAIPSRSPGALLDIAHGRRAKLDVAYVDDDGVAWRLLHLVDGDQRKAEAHLYRNGEPYSDGQHVSNGKVRAFDRLIAARWPTWSLLAASRFWTQTRAGDWTERSGADRRTMLRELLGLGRFQQIAEAAGDRLRLTTDDLERAREGLCEWQAARVRADDLETRIADANQSAKAAEADLSDAEGRVEQARAQLDAARQAANGIEAARLLVRRSELTTAIGEVRKLLARVADDDHPDGLQAARQRLDDAKAATARAAAERRAFNDYAAVVARSEREIERCRAAAGEDRPDVAYAQHDAEQCEQAVEAAAERVRVQEWRTQQGAQLGRLCKRSALLDEVPCRNQPALVSACGLIADAREARAGIDAVQADIDLAEVKLSALPKAPLAQTKQNLANAKGALLRAENRARAWAELDRREVQLMDLLIEAPAEPEPDDALRAEERDAQGRYDDHVRAQRDVADRKASLQGELGVLTSELARMPPEADLRQRAREEGWTGPPIAQLANQVTNATGAVTLARQRLRAAQLEAARCSGARAEIGDVDERITDAQATVDRLTVDVEQLGRLRHAFGSRGIQAVLVDAAGPAIAETATRLLAVAYARERFTVEIQTQREKRDGKGRRDVMDAVVHDADTGVQGVVENLSGGEKDMVRAALALALSQHHSEVAGVRWRTAWADEAGAWLTRENAARWVAMVRAAAEELGLHQVLLVTHDDEVIGQCDAQVRVEDLSCSS